MCDGVIKMIMDGRGPCRSRGDGGTAGSEGYAACTGTLTLGIGAPVAGTDVCGSRLERSDLLHRHVARSEQWSELNRPLFHQAVLALFR